MQRASIKLRLKKPKVKVCTPPMSLESGTPSGSGNPADNTGFNLENTSSGSANEGSNLDNFGASFWRGEQSISQPQTAQLFDGLFQVESPAQLSRQLDAGFSKEAVEAALKEQISQGDQIEELPKGISNIKVVYVDKANDPSQRISKADFSINEKGDLNINIPDNKDLLNKKELVIEIEREQGQVKEPTDAQKQGLATLLQSLSETVLDKNNGKIDDQQGLIPKELREHLPVSQLPTEFPEAMQQAMHSMQRFAGGGRGTMSSGDADRYFPARETDRLPNEDNAQASLKDVIAGFATQGEREPYFAVHPFGDRGDGVGRYMLTGNLLLEWLDDLLEGTGEPPNLALIIAKLAKALKNKDLANKLGKLAQSGEMKQFFNDLKSGKLKPSDPQTRAALEKFLPKELQEVATSQLVEKFQKAGESPSQVAMHMLLGHKPTDADMSRPEYQRLKQSVDRLSTISDARTNHPHEKIDWQDVDGRLVCIPVQGRITSEFGMRRDPVSGKYVREHHGVDIAGPNHAPIRVAGDAKVVFSGRKGGYGNFVELDHGNGIRTRYGHLSQINVKPGEMVRAGEVLGLEGSTGHSTGPHLHFEIRKDGVAVNPLPFLKKMRTSLDT